MRKRYARHKRRNIFRADLRGAPHHSIAAIEGMKERTIFLHGFSKAFAMTGFRIGYACAPRELIEGMMKAHQYALMCAPIVSQEAAIEALVNGKSSMEKMRDQYHRRRDFIVGRFNEMGLKCHLPKGDFLRIPKSAGIGRNELNGVCKIYSRKGKSLRLCRAPLSGNPARDFCAQASRQAMTTS